MYIESATERTCDNEKFMAIYEGPAAMITDEDGRLLSVLVEHEDIAFDLQIRDTIRDCGHIIQRTEHPSLYVERSSQAGFNRNVEAVQGQEFNLIAYINTKFVFFDRKLEKQLTNLYDVLQMKRCQHFLETVKH